MKITISQTQFLWKVSRKTCLLLYKKCPRLRIHFQPKMAIMINEKQYNIIYVYLCLKSVISQPNFSLNLYAKEFQVILLDLQIQKYSILNTFISISYLQSAIFHVLYIESVYTTSQTEHNFYSVTMLLSIIIRRISANSFCCFFQKLFPFVWKCSFIIFDRLN